MFKWVKKLIKKLFTPAVKEVEEVATEAVEVSEEVVLPDGMTQEDVDAMKAMAEELMKDATKDMVSKAMYHDLEESHIDLTVRLVFDTFMKVYGESYTAKIKKEHLQQLWGHIEPTCTALVDEQCKLAPNRSVYDICNDICVNAFEDHLTRMFDNLKRIMTEEMEKKIQEAIATIDNQDDLMIFFQEKMESFDSFIDRNNQPEVVEEEVAVTVVEEEPITDATTQSIDSFLTAYPVGSENNFPSVAVPQELLSNDIPEDEIEADLNFYLTVDEKCFIEIHNEHPEYAPAAIFHMVHQMLDKKEDTVSQKQ